MPNLTNQPSTSDSKLQPPPNDKAPAPTTAETRPSVAVVEPAEDEREQHEADEHTQQTAKHEAVADVPLHDTQPTPPVSEADVQAELAEEGVPMQAPPPPPSKEAITVDPVQVIRQREGGNRRRSLRMQIRYTRTLLWAARLFVRILVWQWIIKRVAGEKFVQERNVRRWKQYAREFRDFAAQMGGVFIKAGQFISTRADIFPEEIITELEGLQDEIPSVSTESIAAVLRDELGEDYKRHFRWLKDEPIAAASLGQVHRAQLANGDRVVVKVQRPGIVRIIDTDMAALMVVAHVAMRFKFISRRANAVEITHEFGRVLWQEVSYLHEAQNAHHFGRMFQDDYGVYVPSIYDDLSTDRVLVMEDVTSIKINDYARLEAEGVSRKEVARRLMNSYLQQVFDDRVFHADPHPGNLFVYPLPVEDGQEFGEKGRPFYLIYVDFGMTGTLTQQIVDGLISTLIAIVTRDAGRLIQSYEQLDLLLPGADTERLEQATKAAFDQVWGMNMQDLSSVDYEVVEQLGSEFNDLLFDMPFQMPQNFIYLARTMGILSGMCTSLDPNFNPWQELQPYTEKMMRMQASTGGNLGNQLGSTLLQNVFGVSGASSIFEAGSQIITRAVNPNGATQDALARQLTSGDVRVTADPSRKWQIEMHLLDVNVKTATRAVVFSGVLVSSTILLVSGFTWFAAGGYVACSALGWRVLFPPDVLQ